MIKEIFKKVRKPNGFDLLNPPARLLDAEKMRDLLASFDTARALASLRADVPDGLQRMLDKGCTATVIEGEVRLFFPKNTLKTSLTILGDAVSKKSEPAPESEPQEMRRWANTEWDFVLPSDIEWIQETVKGIFDECAQTIEGVISDPDALQSPVFHLKHNQKEAASQIDPKIIVAISERQPIKSRKDLNDYAATLAAASLWQWIDQKLTEMETIKGPANPKEGKKLPVSGKIYLLQKLGFFDLPQVKLLGEGRCLDGLLAELLSVDERTIREDKEMKNRAKGSNQRQLDAQKRVDEPLKKWGVAGV